MFPQQVPYQERQTNPKKKTQIDHIGKRDSEGTTLLLKQDRGDGRSRRSTEDFVHLDPRGHSPESYRGSRMEDSTWGRRPWRACCRWLAWAAFCSVTLLSNGQGSKDIIQLGPITGTKETHHGLHGEQCHSRVTSGSGGTPPGRVGAYHTAYGKGPNYGL
ncbi:hypothetical protein CHS0354_021762 [Potamilus streckersoni]|uniref:Uncharacterized protein n=1 Tax=Potamilus streckersoni TaxID=2493646 RepID=A0AAE0WFK4_9BIVA|nr:hypothetical protein CHS0354_021762 [Potamilus streckersoni]